METKQNKRDKQHKSNSVVTNRNNNVVTKRQQVKDLLLFYLYICLFTIILKIGILK